MESESRHRKILRGKCDFLEAVGGEPGPQGGKEAKDVHRMHEPKMTY
jgi:hypothetical protein